MNDEVKYPVIKPEDLPEEEWQELEDIWKRMEANVKASISNGCLLYTSPSPRDCS